jgi:hypothetical protein
VRTVALVGYTNAGKSTLFNRLTAANVYVADQLFATLDTTLRRVHVARAENIVLSDTVGFIRDLPHDLVVAFRATLAEAADADLLLHVIDASADNRDEQIEAVDALLAEIGASRRSASTTNATSPGCRRASSATAVVTFRRSASVRLAAPVSPNCALRWPNDSRSRQPLLQKIWTHRNAPAKVPWRGFAPTDPCFKPMREQRVAASCR